MTALEAIATVRGLGGRLGLVAGRLRVETPTGALTPELRKELERHKPELLVLLGVEQRQAVVERRISEAFDRLTAAGGPWPAELFAAVRPLAQALDEAAAAYMKGKDFELGPFERALVRWEDAIQLRVGRQRGSLAAKQELIGAREDGLV